MDLLILRWVESLIEGGGASKGVPATELVRVRAQQVSSDAVGRYGRLLAGTPPEPRMGP